MEINATVDNQTIFNFDDLDPKVQELVKKSVEARKFAYCPYSNFAVGAALRTSTGEIFLGCNVENGAYSPSICAERTAICKAVSEGFKEFEAVAVCAFQENSFTSPCGVCRQTIVEFAKKDIKVYMTKPAASRVLVTSIYELVPHRFHSQ